MGLGNFFEWSKWLLEFNPLKYIGILLMIGGPLFSIYLFIFRSLEIRITLLASLFSFLLGLIVWVNGWDPYETILEGRIYDFMKL